MRAVTCVPVLGCLLLAAAASAQLPPGCQDVHRTLIERARPAVAPGIPPGEAVKPAPPATLRATLLETPPPRKVGANRTVIERAIRALASRIFPGKAAADAQASRTPPAGFTLFERSFQNADFRFIVGQEGSPAPPCPAFVPQAQ